MELLGACSCVNKKGKEHFDQALTLFEGLPDNAGIANSYTGLGNLNFDLHNYPMALECFQKALDVKEQIGNIIGNAEAIGNIGLVYRGLSEYTKSIEYYKKSLAISEQIGDIKTISFNRLPKILQSSGLEFRENGSSKFAYGRTFVALLRRERRQKSGNFVFPIRSLFAHQ